jgi:hypothetical protein
MSSSYNIEEKQVDLCGNIKAQKWKSTKTAKRISELQQTS